MALAHALLVEDRDDLADLVETQLRGLAWVHRVASDDEALRACAQVLPDVVVTDVRGVDAHDNPLGYVASLALALERCARAVRAPVPPIVLHSGLDPDVLRAIATTVQTTRVVALPRLSPRAALRALVESLTAPQRRTESRA